MGARIRLCISESNCKDTEAFKLQIVSPCRTAKVSEKDIGKIPTAFVPYQGSSSMKISSAPWPNTVTKSIDTALYPADPICGEYRYVVSICDDADCTTSTPIDWATASTDTDGGVILSFDATDEQTANTNYNLVLTVGLNDYYGTTETSVRFTAHIKNCVSLPDTSAAAIDSRSFLWYTSHTLDISANLDKVKETVQCGYSFTYTPKLLVGNELVSFDDGEYHADAPEIKYDSNTN